MLVSFVHLSVSVSVLPGRNSKVISIWTCYSRVHLWTEQIWGLCTLTCATCASSSRQGTRRATTVTSSTRRPSCAHSTSKPWRSTTPWDCCRRSSRNNCSRSPLPPLQAPIHSEKWMSNINYEYSISNISLFYKFISITYFRVSRMHDGGWRWLLFTFRFPAKRHWLDSKWSQSREEGRRLGQRHPHDNGTGSVEMPPALFCVAAILLNCCLWFAFNMF